jgi:hypothetical protein
MLNDLMISSKIAKKNFREIVTPYKKTIQTGSVLLPELAGWKGTSSTSNNAFDNTTPSKNKL